MNKISHRPSHKQALKFETRPDWVLCYPPKLKQADWQSNFTGVVHLAAAGQHFWVNVWDRSEEGKARYFILRLQAKDHEPGARTYSCELHKKRGRYYVGSLTLDTVHYRVVGTPAGQCVHVHFLPQRKPEG